MKRNLLAWSMAFMIIGSIFVPITAFADTAASDGRYLNIATVDSRPLSVDRLLYVALQDIDHHASFTLFPMQTGYALADSGEQDGVIASTPDLELAYPNLRKVPVAIERTNIMAFVRSDSGLEINGWNDLSGRRVGILAQRPYTTSRVPSDAAVTAEDSVRNVLNLLVQGKVDVAVLGRRAHEETALPEGVEQSGRLEVLDEYLYVNKSRENLIPSITSALDGVLADGRGERILNDMPPAEMSSHKTVLHIVSSNMEVQREDQLYARAKDQFKDDDSLEWYSIALNARRFPLHESRLANIAQTIRQDCVSKNVAAIVVSGEEALGFLSDYYLLLFRNTPVIFYGIDSDYALKIRSFDSNFTGILETVSADEVAAQALRFFPETKNIFVINDYTPQGRNYRAAIEEQLKPLEGSLHIEYSENTGREAILERIRSLPEDSLVFTGSYFRDANGQYYSQNEMKRVFEETCEVPIFTLYSMSPGYHAIGGKFPDYEVYGETVAGMLERLLDGGNAGDIPIISDSSGFNRWVFDMDVMDQWGVKVRSLPEGASIVNSTPSVWESDPKFALALVALVVVSVGAFLGINLFVLKYRKRLEDLHTAEQLLEKDVKIREVKERLERTISASPISYLLCIDNQVIEINERMKNDTGLGIGDDVLRVYPDPSLCEVYTEQILRDGILSNQIARFQFADGKVHRCILNAVLADYEGQKGIAVWLLDIEQDEIKKDQLQAAQMNLQTILDTMPAPVGIVDIETMKVVYGNDAYLKLLEYDSVEDVYGRDIRETQVIIKDDGSEAPDLCEHLVRFPEMQVAEIRSVTKTGAITDLRIVTRPIEYKGRPSAIGIMTDLSKEKELESSRRSLQTILDMLPVAIRILDIENDAIVYINKATADLFELAPDEIESVYGQSASGFMPETQPDGLSSEEKLLDSHKREKPGSAEVVCMRNGKPFDCLVTSCVIDYEGVKASLGIMEDLTAEKEYQNMLLSAAEKEREANQLKGRFLVNMSHEIRTPMNAIIGLTEIELRKNPSRETKEVYRKINDSAKNLLQIINDILDLSKIEADKIELFEGEFELEEVISSALLVASPRLDGKNVEFMLNASLDLPRFVIGDRTRLWQILKNFLDNSAKYTEEGKIVLSVFENKGRSDDGNICVAFIVEDTGIGIDEEQIQKIFRPYEQFYSEAQKKYTGTGLGMAISKQLCELMGGEVQIDSTVGAGTTILLNIPFKRSQNPETGSQAVKSQSLTGAHILAVDDDSVSLEIMSNLLKSSDARYMLAHSGTEAMEIILKNRDMGKSFDLILLDYMMDGLDGLETARQIQTSLSKSPKLLMVTAYQRMLLKDDLDKNGIEDVIEKPFIPSQFINKICVTLGYGDEIIDTQEAAFQRFSGAHVLLCEDYRLNQEVACGMFAQFGVTATIAEDGRQGVEILNEGQDFDLIFMDLQMPVMDGYEATRVIRADPRFDHIPIVSLTADAMKEIVDRCLEMGMNDHVAKPIEFARLNEIFLKWLPESKRVSGEMTGDDGAYLPSEGLMRFGGNRELYEKALLELAGDLPDEWPDFDGALRDMDGTRRFVHKLKGASGNLAVKDVYEYAVGFERSLRDSDPDRDLYEKLVSASGAFKKSTCERAREMTPDLSDTGTPEEFGKRLDELYDALQSYDPKACTKAVNALKEKAWPQAGPELSNLCKLALQYEFDAALEVIDGMKEYNK